MALGLKLAGRNDVVQSWATAPLFLQPAIDPGGVGQYKLPVLTVVLDNSGWAAVKEATLRVYPDGEARAGDAFGAILAPDMNFAMVAQAAVRRHGELLYPTPAAVEGAIARCLDAVGVPAARPCCTRR